MTNPYDDNSSGGMQNSMLLALRQKIGIHCQGIREWASAITTRFWGLVIGVMLLSIGGLVIHAWSVTGDIRTAWAYAQGQRILVDPSEVFLGEMEINSSNSAKVDIRNLSGDTRNILLAHMSCGCLSIEPQTPIELMPHSSRTIVIRFSPTDQRGPASYRIQFIDDMMREHLVTVEGNISPEIHP